MVPVQYGKVTARSDARRAAAVCDPRGAIGVSRILLVRVEPELVRVIEPPPALAESTDSAVRRVMVHAGEQDHDRHVAAEDLVEPGIQRVSHLGIWGRVDDLQQMCRLRIVVSEGDPFIPRLVGSGRGGSAEPCPKDRMRILVLPDDPDLPPINETSRRVRISAG